MLARQRAAELEDEIGDVARDCLEARDAVGRLEIHHGPDVQAADRRVRVDARRRPVARDDREKPLDVVAQLLGRDGRVFHERQRFGVALHRHRQAERRLAQAPDARLVGGRHEAPPSAAET